MNGTHFENIGGYSSEMNINRLEALTKSIQNTATTLSRSGNNYGDGDDRRSIDDECGYPATEDLDPDSYRFLYDRFGVAERVVNILPMESWKGQPTIFEDESNDEGTEFEKAWGTLGNQLIGESKFRDEEGSPIWEFLMRLDIISGIGSFGVLLLGLDDGAGDLSKEVKKASKLLWLQTYDESLVTVSAWDEEPESPRYLQPLTYQIAFGDPRVFADSPYPQVSSKEVHWSRIIHVADNILNNEVLGVPRMRPVYNHLYDLRKLYGGSGEMYWKGAFPGYFLETHPQLGPDVQVNTTSIATQMEQMQNSLQRYGVLNGMTANQMAPQVVDPSPQIARGIEALCIRLACPVKVFTGSGPGGLGAKEDHDQDLWDDRMRDRKRKHNTPRIIVPFIDRLIDLGVLPEPAQYGVKWDDKDESTPGEKALILTQRTEAMSKYVAGGVDQLMQPVDFLTKEMGYSSEEAEEIIDEAFSPEQTPDDPSSMFKGAEPDPFEVEAAKQGAFPDRVNEETGEENPFVKPGASNLDRSLAATADKKANDDKAKAKKK